jgi:hypothetical protein
MLDKEQDVGTSRPRLFSVYLFSLQTENIIPNKIFSFDVPNHKRVLSNFLSAYFSSMKTQTDISDIKLILTLLL